MFVSISRSIALVCSFLYPLSTFAQEEGDRLNLPGDNLNLAAVLDVFRQSPTMEAFEAALNADTSKINNLDLDNDGKVDYIRVQAKEEGAVHTIVLQTDLADKEVQDIAVIYVEKKGDAVEVQVVGDEDLYGKEYIVEPSSEGKTQATPNPAYTGQTVNNYYYNTENNYYNSRPDYCEPVSSWLIVGYMYGPVYIGWSSPYYWGYYPVWWSPWAPSYWDVYYHHWYYKRPWHGWWYWRAPNPRFTAYYGPYRTHRRASAVYMGNRNAGVYQRTYVNPHPAPRPAGKQNFPSHALRPEKNKALVRPAPPKTVRPQPSVGKPVTPGRSVKPATRPVPEKAVPSRTAPAPKTSPPLRKSTPTPKPAPKPVPKSAPPVKKPASSDTRNR